MIYIIVKYVIEQNSIRSNDRWLPSGCNTYSILKNNECLSHELVEQWIVRGIATETIN